MKKVCLLCLLAYLWGYSPIQASILGLDTITSSFPSSSTVYLDPGQVQEFAVTVKQSSVLAPYPHSERWRLNNLNGSDASTYEPDKLLLVEGSDGLRRSYHPDELSPGTYQLLYFREYSYQDAVFLQLPRKEWKVVVRGVEVVPELTMAVPPGQTIEYKATAHPSSTYTYRWYLDGSLVRTGKTFAFTPTAAQPGPHTLKVTATSYLGKTYTYTRDITVPFAMIPGGDMSSFKRTGDGGYIVAGWTERTDIPGQPNHGAHDAYAVRYDKDGKLLWQKLIGGSMSDRFMSVEPTADGGCVLAGLSESTDIPGLTSAGRFDMLVVRLNGQGAIVWQKLIGGPFNDYGKSVVSSGDGGFYLAGKSDYSFQSGPDYGAHCFVAKLDSQGTILWEKDLGSTVSDTGNDLMVGADGSLVVAGLYGGSSGMIKVSPSDAGGVIWQAATGHELYAIGSSHEGGYVGLGNAMHSQSGWNAYVVGVSDSGAIGWQRLLDDAGYNEPSAIIRNPAGGYVLAAGVSTGTTYQEYETCGSIVRLADDGSFLSRKLIREIYFGAHLADALLTGADSCMALIITYWGDEVNETCYLVPVILP